MLMAARVGSDSDTLPERGGAPPARVRSEDQTDDGAATEGCRFTGCALDRVRHALVARCVLAFYGSLHAEKHIAGSPLREARGSAGLPAEPGVVRAAWVRARRASSATGSTARCSRDGAVEDRATTRCRSSRSCCRSSSGIGRGRDSAARR